jgi:hypothetical protein
VTHSTRSYLLRLLAIAIVSVLMAGCSYSSTFAVLNETETPLTVEYQIGPNDQPKGTGPPRYPIDNPAIKPLDDLYERNVKWQTPRPDSAMVDAERGFVTVQVPPRTALRLAEAVNYMDSDWTHDVNITRIKLTGSSGTIALEGDQVQKHFIETDGVYSLKYR